MGPRAKAMPELESPYFGTVSYQPDAVIHFPLGLPGLEGERQFLLIEQAVNKPVEFLQSLANSGLCLAALPVSSILPGYRLSLSAEDTAALGLPVRSAGSGDPELLCLAVVSLEEDGPTTANLLAPILIHWRGRLAVQSVPDHSEYSHRHPLLPATVGPCVDRQETVACR